MRKIFISALVTLIVILSVLTVSADIADDLAPETNADGVEIAVSVEDERENLIDILEDATPEEVFMIRDKLEEAFLDKKLDGLDGFGKFYLFIGDYKDLISAALLFVAGVLIVIASRILGKKIETNNNNMLAAFKGSSEIWDDAKKTVDGYTESNNAVAAENQKLREIVLDLMEKLQESESERAEETQKNTAAISRAERAERNTAAVIVSMIELTNLDDAEKKRLMDAYTKADEAIDGEEAE